MIDPKLDPRPSRELSSREAAKIIGATLGGLALLCRPETIFAALDFYTTERYQPMHEAQFRAMWQGSVASGQVVPDKSQD